MGYQLDCLEKRKLKGGIGPGETQSKQRSREMAQLSIKCLPRKHEDLCFVPITHGEKTRHSRS